MRGRKYLKNWLANKHKKWTLHEFYSSYLVFAAALIFTGCRIQHRNQRFQIFQRFWDRLVNYPLGRMYHCLVGMHISVSYVFLKYHQHLERKNTSFYIGRLKVYSFLLVACVSSRASSWPGVFLTIKFSNQPATFKSACNIH